MKREVQVKLTELRQTILTGSRPVPDARLPPADYLDAVAGSRERRTQEKDAQGIRDHIIPALGGVPLNRLEPRHLQHLQQQPRGRGLASPTVHGIVATLRHALDDPVRIRRLIPANPAVAVTVTPDTPADVLPLSLAHIRAIIAAVRGNRYEAAAFLDL